MRGALILLILASVSVVAGSAPSVPVLRDVDLGVDASGLHTTADVYCPAEPIYPCQVLFPTPKGYFVASE